MAPNMRFRMALSDSDDGTRVVRLHQVAAKVLGLFFNFFCTNFIFQLAYTRCREIADNASPSVKLFIAVGN